jgi:N-sulfoglucosamine sulfohydrolase
MSEPARPNILWITTHDINPDLGCYAGIWPGAEYADTPHLDQLAAEGVRYDNAYAVAPVCAPSRSAILTGMYPTAIGTMHMRSRAIPPPEVHCFPEYLRAAGYYCTNNAFSDLQFQTPITVWDASGPSAHWRNRPDPQQPFFAVFHGMQTHESQVTSDDARYALNTARLTPDQRHDPEGAPLPPYYPDTPVFRQAWARYSDNISAMDHWAGDLLQQLADDGLADSTLVVFWSDHGKGMPRAKRWANEAGLRVPLLMRWPGKLPANTVRSELTAIFDLSATMLAVVGIPVPNHLHARPLFDVSGSANPTPREYVFGHRDRMDEQEDTVRTVRATRLRYIRNYHPDRPVMQHHEYADQFPTWKELRRLYFEESQQHGRGEVPDRFTPVQRALMASSKAPEELYDLHTDPHELHNLAADPAYAADLMRLRNALDAWQATYGDLGLIREAELTERWRPGGVTPQTEPPIISQHNGALHASCATAGASIAYTFDPPQPPQPISGFDAVVGNPDTGGRQWHLYHVPLVVAGQRAIWFRAERIGFRASVDVEAMKR